MKKNQQRLSENYLERVPIRPARIPWSQDSKGSVTLDVENKGLANRIAQWILRKPKVSHIHLDELGSFVWPLIDGETDLVAIGEQVERRFGKKAHPTYERLAKFFQILESYRFIEWKDR